MSVPTNLKYTKEHEWIRVEGETAIVGITDFAKSELGEIVFIEVETVGETMAAGEVFGTVEAVKTVSDLYLPIDGKILAFNEDLEDAPELVNEDAFGKGWMIKMEITDASQLLSLLSAAEYEALIGA